MILVPSLQQVISGGQTGADQAGLFAARSLGIATGGCAPLGWRTDAGPAPWLGREFGLVEHADAGYVPRTYENIKVACVTLWVGTVSPGYHCTRKAKHYFQRPWLVNPTPEALRDWLNQLQPIILNVAGNRARTNPGIGERVQLLLTEAIDGHPRLWAGTR